MTIQMKIEFEFNTTYMKYSDIKCSKEHENE